MKIEYFEVKGKKFTRRAMQIISKLRDGWVHKEIASFFGVKKGTLDHEVSYYFHKAGFKNAKELVAFLAENGLQAGGIFCGIDLFATSTQEPEPAKQAPKPNSKVLKPKKKKTPAARKAARRK